MTNKITRKSKLVFKIFIHFVSIVVIFIMLLSAGIGTLYKTFVVTLKERQMIRIYNSLKARSASEIAQAADDINFSYNIRIYVTDSDLKQVGGKGFAPWDRFKDQDSRIIKEYIEKLSGKDYLFVKDFDMKKPPDSMMFLAKLDNGGYMVGILSYFFVRENISYSIYFILLFSVVAIILCGIVSYMLAKRISTPIINITEIAQKMATLDFSTKCSVNSNDELGVLGDNVNILSEELKRNISELRCEIEKERKIDEMRKNLIINVSHELKTPIFLIQSYAEGLEQNISGSQEDRNYYCSVISDEAKRMDVMVKELLSLARLEAGQQKMNITSFKLSEFADGIVKKHCITVSAKNADLVCSIPDITVQGDDKMLGDAFNNLLVNAIDYVNEHGNIEITCEQKEQSVLLKVYNSGSHINEDEFEKIWQSFYKIDKSRTRGYGGTGIGLAEVKAVMEAHGTDYGVCNRGDGVEFYIEIKKGSK